MRKGDNPEIKKMVLDRLASVEFTHTYLFNYREKGMVRAAIVEDADEILPLITYAEHHEGKKHNGWAIRMDGCKANVEIIKTYAREIFDVCTVKFLENEYAVNGRPGSNNRGHILERLNAEILGGVQNKKSNLDCTLAGDIVVNGEHIQCKMWNATVTTEATVNNFLAKRNF